MFEIITELSTTQWVVMVFCAIVFGLAKTGVQGIGALAVPLLALVFDAKYSTGLVLPVQIVADTLACYWYRKHVHWKYMMRLIPWTFIGIGLATWAGNQISSETFKMVIGYTVLVALAMMIWNDYYNKKNNHVPHGDLYTAMFGILGGFSSMIGNVGGPIISVFLLSTYLPKHYFVGTAAWIFIIMNISKIPMQLFVWHNISLGSLTMDALMIPFVFVGAYIGIHFVRKVSEKFYRIFVLIITFVSALALLL